VWDGIASVLIGIVLVVVVWALVRANSSLLVGQAAVPSLERALRAEVASLPAVNAVPVFVTTVLGPGRLFVAAKVEFADHCMTADIERVADEAERRLVPRYPGVEQVFLDPTGAVRKQRPDVRPGR